MNPRTCVTCGALVNPGYVNKHNGWHTTIEGKVREAQEQARRAKRLAKN